MCNKKLYEYEFLKKTNHHFLCNFENLLLSSVSAWATLSTDNLSKGQ